MRKEKLRINVKKFIAFHRKRVFLLEKFVNGKSHGRLIFQVSFLGFESLAKLLYPKEKESKKRFINLLSFCNVGINKEKAIDLYVFWRNSLIHQGFVDCPWTTLEGWGEDDDFFIIFPNRFRSSVEYPPGSIWAMYKNFVDYFEKHFEENDILDIEFEY